MDSSSGSVAESLGSERAESVVRIRPHSFHYVQLWLHIGRATPFTARVFSPRSRPELCVFERLLGSARVGAFFLLSADCHLWRQISVTSRESHRCLSYLLFVGA